MTARPPAPAGTKHPEEATTVCRFDCECCGLPVPRQGYKQPPQDGLCPECRYVEGLPQPKRDAARGLLRIIDETYAAARAAPGVPAGAGVFKE
jgi:hypothetical protein